jgi:hypothetical protein
MNKPITPNKFVTDLWGMMQMAIEEAVLAEREACAKVCESYTDKSDSDHETHGYACAAEIRARGDKHETK